MKLGLLGRRLSHSLSVPIHRMYFEKIGAKDSYELLELEPERAADLRRVMETQGFDGLNVTVPYKQAVMDGLDGLTEEAKRIGAVNTILLKNGRMTGHNTDLYGFNALLKESGVDVKGRTVALLGATGGAAKAGLLGLIEGGAGKVLLVSRNAADLKSEDARRIWTSYEALEHTDFDIIVNATPLGMYPHIDASPVARDVAARAGALIDMIYNPSETRVMAYARAAGRKAVNGMTMLVAQAIAAEAFWRNESVDEAAIRSIEKAMREAV